MMMKHRSKQDTSTKVLRSVEKEGCMIEEDTGWHRQKYDTKAMLGVDCSLNLQRKKKLHKDEGRGKYMLS
ncbi:hypothetical protein V6N11_072419 [Hibiscus sabdariffa]|uniref:Uncharacterized protein n=1 Tax=Hibiscus sabdariffa TaxID=183260 RepID=A0ABR2U386_9ROSI